MAAQKLGRTLIIANPTSQSGKGAEGAQFVGRFLDSYTSATNGHDLKLTEAEGHATQIAAQAAGYDTVIALGGDGVIHEVVNGLMQVDADKRPQLGIIPLGSGNDYARTLGMAINSPEDSLAQIMAGDSRPVDLGLVNGMYFSETLSFGCDAAIALDTMNRRQAHGSHGTRLFASSGVDILKNHLRDYAYRGTMDGQDIEGRSIVFAVQIGPTYGGGFKICPDASPSDGLLSCCRNIKRPSKPHVLALFARARLGMHTGSSYLSFDTCSKLTLDFDEELPVQADGERVEGTHFEISCEKAALRAIFAKTN